MACQVVNSQSRLQARLPTLPAKLPSTQGEWAAFTNTLRQWGQALQQEQHPPNVIPAQFQTFQVAAATPVIAALTGTNCTPSIDNTQQYYGTASLKVTISSSGATLSMNGRPIAIAAATRWFCSFQILAPSGCTGELSVLATNGAHSLTETFTVPASGSWQQVWGLFDFTQWSDVTATWEFSFTTTATVWIDGMQMNAMGDPIGFLPRFAGTQMVAGAAAYAANLDGVPDGSTYQRPLATALNAGQVDLSKAGVISKTLDNITDSSSRIAWDPASRRRGVSYGQNLVINGDFGRGDTRNWTLSPEGSVTPVYTGPTVSQDSTANIGGYSGVFGGTNAEILTDYLIPVDTTKSYYIEVRVKDGGGTAGQTFYGGFACYDSTKTAIPIEPAGATFNYDLAGNIAQPASWTIYSDIISGVELAGNHSVAPNDSQFTSHSKFRYGTAYICPMFLPNRGASGGLFAVDYVRIVQIASLDNEVTDGATYGRPLLSRLSSGKPWIDFSEGIHANKILDNIADGSTYGRVKLSGLTSGFVDGSLGGIQPKGNIPPQIQNGAFSYTSTTSSIDWSWPAITNYRPDGSTQSVTSSSQNVTGLAINATYYAYAYVDESAPSTMAFVSGQSGQAGTPSIAILSTATLSVTAPCAALAWKQGRIYMGKITGVTPNSGTGGGGGGGGGGCPHPKQRIDTPHGWCRAGSLAVGDKLLTAEGVATIVRLSRPRCAEWFHVEFRNGSRVCVTADHRFMTPDADQVRARDLRIGQILAGSGAENMEVIGLRLDRTPADAVALELEAPHLYLIVKNGPLSHNPKP